MFCGRMEAAGRLCVFYNTLKMKMEFFCEKQKKHGKFPKLYSNQSSQDLSVERERTEALNGLRLTASHVQVKCTENCTSVTCL